MQLNQAQRLWGHIQIQRRKVLQLIGDVCRDVCVSSICGGDDWIAVHMPDIGHLD